MDTLAERVFKLSERGTDMRTEVIAGITTFMAMAYIIFVNPSILQMAGMPFGPLAVSTCLAAAIATLLMAFLANYPVALASSMGLNAFFAYSVCGAMGVPWQTALGAIMAEGVIFVVLSLTHVRSMIVDSVPISLKHAIASGIGIFIALIGLINGGVVVSSEATILTFGQFKNNAPAILTIAGIIVIGALEARRVKGAILWGMLLITIVSMPLGITELPDAPLSMPPSIAPIFMKMDLSGLFSLDFWTIVFTFLFVDMFDTIGTLIGTAGRAGLLDEEGRLKGSDRALLADSLGTCAGAALGVSTVASFVESAAGVGVGGRTGLSSVVTAVLFLLAIFFGPVIGMVPACATAPALVFVGIYMLMEIRKMNYDDWTELLPSAAAVLVMPFAYSVSAGIEMGFISYALVKLMAGRAKEVPIAIWILSIVFVAKECCL